MARSVFDRIPQLNLKGEDFYHEVPENINLELYVEWKKKGLDRDFVSNVTSFEKKEGKLAIVNGRLPNTAYTYKISEIKKVFVVFDPTDKEILDGGK